MVTQLDPERALALAYVPRDVRQSVGALWMLDARLGAVLAASRDPTLAMLKLAWWREQLAALASAPLPADPDLAVLHDDIRLRPLGAELADLAEGWAAVAGESDAAALERHAGERGAKLFGLTGKLLAPELSFDVAPAGSRWALVDHARRSDAERALGLSLAAAQPHHQARWPRALRPLGMLDALASRDIAAGHVTEPAGAPARVLRMIRHRLTGR